MNDSESGASLCDIWLQHRRKAHSFAGVNGFDGAKPFAAGSLADSICVGRELRRGSHQLLEDGSFGLADDASILLVDVGGGGKRKAAVTDSEPGAHCCHRRVEKPSRPKFPFAHARELGRDPLSNLEAPTPPQIKQDQEAQAK